MVGGIVPWFARTLAHDQLPDAWAAGNSALAAVMLAVVLGCALFSAITVYKFGRATFNDTRKALGFVAAIEGVMLVSTGATSDVALLVLILINALANGSSIALAREATCKRREASARASVTRAQSRASRSNRSRATEPASPRGREVIEVVDDTVAARGTGRAPARVVKVPRWTAAAEDTIIDAEIVS